MKQSKMQEKSKKIITQKKWCNEGIHSVDPVRSMKKTLWHQKKPGLAQKPLPCPLLLLYHFQIVNAVSFHAWLNSLCYHRTMLSSYHFQKHWFVQWNMLKHNIHTTCPKINVITKRWRNKIRRRQKKSATPKRRAHREFFALYVFYVYQICSPH